MDGSVDFNGTVRFPNATNLASGAAVVVFGPNGATASFPAVSKGDTGLSPTLTFAQVQVAYGTSLPGTNPAVVFTPGSGSTPDNYAITTYLNAGATGSTGTPSILTASDLEGTAQGGYVIGYSNTDSMAQWQPKLCGGYFFTNTFSATSSNTVALKSITSITISALPFAWWPEVSGQVNVIGAVDTRVDLVARINSTSGNVCGYGMGLAGAAPPPPVLQPYGLTTGSNTIAAGSAATIFFNAENQTASSNPWNTTSGGVSSGYFSVKVAPVPS